MTDVTISKYNEAYVYVNADRGILREIADHFTFDVPGAKHMPKFKNRMWDGKIRLLNLNTQLLYSGLCHRLVSFCERMSYTYKIDDELLPTKFKKQEAIDFLNKQDFKLKPRDYQIRAFMDAVRMSRGLFLSPTASGKSFIMYMIMRWFLKPTIIIVPTTTLVHQLYSDFESYGFHSEKFIHKIYAGQSKDTEKPVIITTWQSVYKQPASWFSRFDLVLGDEAHLFKAKSLITIMTKLSNCKYRYGFTGTIDDSQTHQWVLEGLFGPIHRVVTTKELMDDEHVAKLNINIITLRHDEKSRNEYRDLIKSYKNDKRKAYQFEMRYLTQHEKRNHFIKNLCISLKGNTLLLFRFVDNHGRLLYNLIQDEVGDSRSVYFVHGGVKGEDRDQIRKIVETEKNAIIVASFGVFSTGINILNINSLVLGSPFKSKILNLQSIGRILRTTKTKKRATLYDIADELVSTKTAMNFTLRHLLERVKIYDREQFQYKTFTVNL